MTGAARRVAVPERRAAPVEPDGNGRIHRFLMHHVLAKRGYSPDGVIFPISAAILRDRVTDIPATIRLSRAAMANIRQNVTIALGLKAVFLVTSVLGLTGLWIAILADTGATVLVTLNALRLLRFNPEREA